MDTCHCELSSLDLASCHLTVLAAYLTRYVAEAPAVPRVVLTLPGRCESWGSPLVFALQVTFEGTWSLASHPQAYVGSAHWSPPVVAAHSSDYVMWELGGIATSGVEIVAETGSTFTLRNELQALQGQSVRCNNE